jgi:hypothetical protein
LRLQPRLAIDEPARLKKVRDDNHKAPRRKALIVAQLLTDSPTADAAAEVKE